MMSTREDDLASVKEWRSEQIKNMLSCVDTALLLNPDNLEDAVTKAQIDMKRINLICNIAEARLCPGP